MQILIVSKCVPYPPSFGGAARVYHLARVLARDHGVSLLCYGSAAEREHVATLAARSIEVQTVPPPPGARWRRLYQARSLVGRPFHYYNFYSGAMTRALHATLARRRFDVVQIEFSEMAYHPVPPGPIRILDEHNVEFLLLDRVWRQERKPLRRLYGRVHARKFRPDELAACRRMNAVLTTSDKDRSVLRAEGIDVPMHVIPNGVDVEFFTPDQAPVQRPRLLFTGAINYVPNTDAVIHFCRDILPAVRTAVPEVSFAIVGRDPPGRVRRLTGPSVVVTGTVPDVRPWMREATVFVVPLRSGSGTRLKILEALASGCAVVSTSIGCEGLDVTHGEDILIADTPAEFAQAVVRSLRDPELRARLGARGRTLVERQYRWDAIGGTLSALYTELLEARAKADTSMGSLAATGRAETPVIR